MSTTYNLITNRMRYYSSENFLQSITSADDYLYMFLAKSSLWNDHSHKTSGLIDSVLVEREVWKDILCMKRILPSDCFRVIKVNEWVTGTQYSQYDDKVELDIQDPSYYVLANNKIYKCISNNLNSPSTVSPTGTDSGLTTTSDDYIWKFMYGIPSGTDENWNDWKIPGWFPVKEITTKEENEDQWNVMSNAQEGAIYNFRYLDGSNDDLTAGQAITLVGDGEGFAGTVVNNNGIKSISITNSGINYNYVSSVKQNDAEISSVEPILSPIGGHGSNAVAELDGYFIIVGSEFNNTTNPEFFTGNEYRRIGIVSNPLRKINSQGTANTKDVISGNEFIYGERLKKSAIDNRINLTISTDGIDSDSQLNLENLSTLLVELEQADIKVTQAGSSKGTATGLIISSDSSNNILSIVSDQEPSWFEVSRSITVELDSTSYSANVIDIDTEDIIRYEGDILYIENLDTAISRGSDQIDRVKMVLQF